VPMSTTTQGEIQGLIDARPVRPTSNTTPWDRAVAQRDQIAALVRETLAKEGLEAAVFISQNGDYPPWVKLEAWLPGGPDPASRERAELEFIIDAKPYHEHDTVTTARLTRGKKKIAVKERPRFDTSFVAEWVRYALGHGGKPGNYRPWLDALLGFVTALIPFVRGPNSNRVLHSYRSRFTGAMALGLLSAVLLLLGFSMIGGHRGYDPPIAGMLVTLVGIIGVVVTALMVRFRKRAVSVTPQSELPPRNLGLVDSWHAVVGELGRDFTNVRQRLIRTITEDAEPGVTAQNETYTHRAPNGYEQRERLVLGKDQGIVHVHIYQFGNDIFVGWHAFLNWAQWGETKPVAMKIREGQEIEFRDLRPSIYIPNQFDLIDLSSLSEFVHRRIEREIKAMLKEKAIDQEIDFKVIRGDRDRALDEERHKGDEKRRKGWSYRAST
jgi:hypothetical protein